MTAKNIERTNSSSETESTRAVENAMSGYDEIVVLSKENTEALFEAATAASNGLETITTEVISYSRQSLAETLAATRALLAAKSAEQFLQLQTTWAKTACEMYVAQMTKLSSLASSTTREALKPIQSYATAFAKSAQARVA